MRIEIHKHWETSYMNTTVAYALKLRIIDQLNDGRRFEVLGKGEKERGSQLK